MKKKVALSATAIAVLASAVPAQVAPVEATGNVIYVDSTKASSNGDFSGTGTQDYPYRQLSTAVEKAQSGDTIIVIGEGYVNDLWDGTPWYIDKDITIRGEGSIPPTISVRTPGIILGANVTFENVALGLANKTHDAIFANGHELNLINVSRAQGTRQVDLFAGGLYGATDYVAGTNPVINVITNSQFVGTINGQFVYSEFGGIYAGSMNTTYDQSAKIKISNTGSTGVLKVAGIYASGAWEADPGTMLDMTEPALPEADPNRLYNFGDVEFTLENVNQTVNGNTGTTSTTSLKSIGKNRTTINATGITNLELEGTTFTVSQNIFTNGLEKLTLSNNAVLDLTNYDTGNFNVSTYKGVGAIALPKEGITINVENDFTPSDAVTFYLAGYNPYGQNGNATKNYAYFTTPTDNATFNYEPSYVDEKLQLKPIQRDTHVEWMVIDPKNPPVTSDAPEGDEEEEEPGELPPPSSGDGGDGPDKDPDGDDEENGGVGGDSGEDGEPDTDPDDGGGEDEPVLPTVTKFTGADPQRVNQKTFSLDNPAEFTFNYTLQEDTTGYKLVGDERLVVKVNGLTFERQADEQGRWYLDNVVGLYIDLVENDDKSVTMRVSPSGEVPALERGYEIELSVGETKLETSLTVVPPAINSLTAVNTQEKTFKAEQFEIHDNPETFFEFSANTTGEYEELSEYDKFDVLINGESTALSRENNNGRVYYQNLEEKVKVYIEKGTDGNYKLVLLSYNGDGPAVPKETEYTIALTYKDGVDPLTFTANVEPAPEVPAPDEPDTDNPTDNYILFLPHEYSNGVTATYEESVRGVETGFLILTKDNTPVDSEFKDLGIDFKFGDSRELGVYRDDTDDYYFATYRVKAKVEKESAGIYKVIFTQLDEQGNPTNFIPTMYDAVVGYNTSQPARLEFTVTQPSTPGPSEPSDEDEVTVEGINVNHSYGTTPEITNGQPFNFTYNVQVTTTENRPVDVSDFNFSHFDTKAVQQGDSGVYTIQESGITLEVTKLEGDNNFQVIMSGESTNLTAASQAITVGINGSDKTEKLYFFVVNSPLKATNIKVPESTSLTVGETNRTISIPIEMTLSRDDSVNKLDYTITLNDRELNSDGNGGYEDPQTGLLLSILPEGETGYNISIYKIDENAIYQYLEQGEYHFEATSDISDDFEFTLVVNPDPIKVVGASIENGQTFTPEQVKSGVKIPLKLDFNNPDVGNLDFTTLGYTVFINSEEAALDGDTYKLVDSNLNVTFLDEGNGNYQVFLFKTDDEGQNVPLPEGLYSVYTDGLGNGDFNLIFSVEEPAPVPDVPSGSGSGSTTPTPKPDPVDPTPTPGDKEEEKPKEEEPTTPPTGGGTGTTPNQPSGGNTSGGTTTPTTPSPSTGGGTTLPAPDPKPEKPVEQQPTVTPQPAPTPVPPQQEVTRPTAKPGAIASAVEALEDLATTIQEKVDSLLTEVIEQAKGLVLDLTGDKDDLSSVSTLEVTKDGVFANVDGEKVKFATDLKLDDLSKLRITRADGSPIPYKTDGESFTLNTHNFSDILITERVAIPFVDVTQDDWFAEYVDEAYNRGITTGTTASTFSPNEAITRGQLAAILARAYELKPTSDKPALKDVADQWYADDVQALVDNGIIKGYEDGTFRGDQPVTREQLAVMLQRLANQQGKDTSVSNVPTFTDTDKMTDYGKSAIEWAASEGIINSGNGVAFKPKSTATRAQVAKMLTLFMNK